VLSIDIATMSHSQDQYHEHIVLHLVDDAVASHAEPPKPRELPFEQGAKVGLLFETVNGSDDT